MYTENQDNGKSILSYFFILKKFSNLPGHANHSPRKHSLQVSHVTHSKETSMRPTITWSQKRKKKSTTRTISKIYSAGYH